MSILWRLNHILTVRQEFSESIWPELQNELCCSFVQERGIKHSKNCISPPAYMQKVDFFQNLGTCILTLLISGFLAYSSPGGGGGADSAILNFTPLNPFNWDKTWQAANYTQKYFNWLKKNRNLPLIDDVSISVLNNFLTRTSNRTAIKVEQMKSFQFCFQFLKAKRQCLLVQVKTFKKCQITGNLACREVHSCRKNNIYVSMTSLMSPLTDFSFFGNVPIMLVFPVNLN